MFQNLIKLMLVTFTQRWFSAKKSNESSHVSPIHPNSALIKKLAVHYGSFFTLLFLNFQLFMGGIIVTAIAVAHSFDTYGKFQTSAVFWTGIIMGFTALVLGALCGQALAKTKVNVQDLIISEPNTGHISLNERFLQPILEGVAEGWKRPIVEG